MSDGIIDERSTSPPVALLADFSFDDDKLKANHKKWLEKEVVTLIRSTAMKPTDGLWEIRLEGAASQVGNDGYNLQLSKRRALQVESYLRGRLPGQPMRFDIVPHGESVPVDPSVKDNAMDRAVAVMVIKKRAPKIKTPRRPKRRPHLIPKVHPRLPKTKNFEIRVVSGEADSIFSISMPTALAKGAAKKIAKKIGAKVKAVQEFLDWLPLPDARFGLLKIEAEIEIRDKLFGRSAAYVVETQAPFVSGGMGKAPKSFKLLRGAKSTFTDRRAMDADDFGGDALLSFAAEKISFGKRAKGKGFQHSNVKLDFKFSPGAVGFGDVGQLVELALV